MPLNFHAAWIGIILGFVAGAVIGLFFDKDDWLGGYASWRRRMVRLGHVSFFGIAAINFAYAVSISLFDVAQASPHASYLLVAGAVTMPSVCFLSAFRKPFRHLFALPVVCLAGGSLLFVIQGVWT